VYHLLSLKAFKLYLCVTLQCLWCHIQFQTSYESMCNLINNFLHNLAQDQWDVTQRDEVNLLILYVSFQHALKSFEVELSN
jgi:hypothetical protein